jgi:5-oxoprolinase (ATP-hydrolysing) subunit A
MEVKKININCDLGEGIPWEAELFPFIQSCSIACGGHFGSEETITKTVLLAKKHNVRVGAHPSYPDPEHFGRQSMDLDENTFKRSVQRQLDLYFKVLDTQMVKNNHIKAHGALYNDLCENELLASWYVDVLKQYDAPLIYTPFQSALGMQAVQSGIMVAYEVFLDRNYDAFGHLISRSHPKALKSNPREVWDQLKEIIETGSIIALNGTKFSVHGDTMCIHGDDQNALENLRFIADKLKEYSR